MGLASNLSENPSQEIWEGTSKCQTNQTLLSASTGQTESNSLGESIPTNVESNLSVNYSRSMNTSPTSLPISTERTNGTVASKLLVWTFGACAGSGLSKAVSPTYEFSTPPTSPFNSVMKKTIRATKNEPIDLTALTDVSASYDVDLTESYTSNGFTSEGGSFDTAMYFNEDKFDKKGLGIKDPVALLTEKASSRVEGSDATTNEQIRTTTVPGESIPAIAVVKSKNKKKGFFCCKRDVEDQVIQ